MDPPEYFTKFYSEHGSFFFLKKKNDANVNNESTNEEDSAKFYVQNLLDT